VSLLAALDAERIKFTTTRAPLWCTVGAAVCSLGLAALQGSTAYGPGVLTPQRAVLGVAVFGVPLLMVLAALSITGEYRTGTIDATLLAVPGRTAVLAAKAGVAAVFAAGCAGLLVPAAVLLARACAPAAAGAGPSPLAADTWRLAVAVGGFAALSAVLAVAVGALLRSSAGAVAVLLLWPLVAEPILAGLPDIGQRLGRLLPFANAFRAVGVDWLFSAWLIPWGTAGSWLYYAAVVAVGFAAAAVVLNRRDA